MYHLESLKYKKSLMCKPTKQTMILDEVRNEPKPEPEPEVRNEPKPEPEIKVDLDELHRQKIHQLLEETSKLKQARDKQAIEKLDEVINDVVKTRNEVLNNKAENNEPIMSRINTMKSEIGKTVKKDLKKKIKPIIHVMKPRTVKR